MIQAIGAIGQSDKYTDPEYLRIIQELMALGIKPSGNKNVDKAKLEDAKKEAAAKLQQNQVQPPENVLNSEKSSLESERVGATKLGELNKVLLGLI